MWARVLGVIISFALGTTLLRFGNNPTDPHKRRSLSTDYGVPRRHFNGLEEFNVELRRVIRQAEGLLATEIVASSYTDGEQQGPIATEIVARSPSESELRTIVTPALSWEYLLSDNPTQSPFGSLSLMTCVCGCNTAAETAMSTVRCAFADDGTARVCVLSDAVLYAQDKPTIAAHSKRLPLVLAVCDLELKYNEIFQANKGQQFWNAHLAFGTVRFDHVSEWRLAHLPPSQACAGTPAGTRCVVPKALTWGGTRRGGTANGWTPDRAVPGWKWAAVSNAPQLNGSTVAFLDSADCWCHDFSRLHAVNPWHCKAGIFNWNVLSALFARQPAILGGTSFTSANATLFALQGYDEYFENRPLVGWYDLKAAAQGGFVADFHDDDHTLRDFLQHRVAADSQIRLVLQGRLPLSVTNAPPALSPIWRSVGDLHDGEPSGVVEHYRKELELVITKELTSQFQAHPVDELLKLSDNVRLVEPPTRTLRQRRAGDGRPSLEVDRALWTRDKDAWRVSALRDLVLVIRRSPHGTDFRRQTTNCGRCLTNIDDVAAAVAQDTGMSVLLVHFSGAVSAALQAYVFMAASVVVGMHGGAWGAAAAMSAGQAAVEVVVQAADQVNAAQIVRPTGALYFQSICKDCVRSTQRSGQADVPDIVKRVEQSFNG